MNRSISIFLATLALLMGTVTAQEAPEIKVTVTGVAEGTGFAARDRAIAAAQQRAVVQALEALVASKDLRPLRPIIRGAASYVTSLSLINQSTQGLAETSVTVELTLNEVALRRDLATLMLPQLAEPVSVLVLTAERLDAAPFTEPAKDNPTEKALLDELEAKSLDLKSLEEIQPYYTGETLKDVMWGELEAGRRFSRENEADAVVVASGVTAVELIAQGASALRHTAIVTLRIFRGDDGKLIDVIVSEAVVNGEDTKECAAIAFGDAARRAASAVRTAAVIAKVSTPDNNQVHITIENPGSRERLAGLVEVLQRNPEVLGVEPRFFHPNLARLRVDYNGSMSKLVEHLQRGTDADTAPTLKLGTGRLLVLAYQ